MRIYINPDGRGTLFNEIDKAKVVEDCCVKFCGVKILGVMFADDQTGEVRVSISEDKHKNFEKIAASLFNNFKKLGKYDSGNYGYEFTAPNLEICPRNR